LLLHLLHLLLEIRDFLSLPVHLLLKILVGSMKMLATTPSSTAAAAGFSGLSSSTATSCACAASVELVCV
jgi:hypothetical protein